MHPNRIRKSIGAENSFEPDLIDRTAMLSEIAEIAAILKRRLDSKQTSGRTLTLKVKYADYQQITRSKTWDIQSMIWIPSHSDAGAIGVD